MKFIVKGNIASGTSDIFHSTFMSFGILSLILSQGVCRFPGDVIP